MLHKALPVPPAALCPAITTSATTTTEGRPRFRRNPVTEQGRHAYAAIFGEDRWRFDAAGWLFHRPPFAVDELSALPARAEQFDWLASHTFQRPIAGRSRCSWHKPLYLNAPYDPELAATSIRYVPMPARTRVVEMLGAVDLRLVASGHVHQRRDFTFGHTRHVWAPSAGCHHFGGRGRELIGIKEVGLGGIPLPARRLRGSRHVRAEPDRYRSGLRCSARLQPPLRLWPMSDNRVAV